MNGPTFTRRGEQLVTTCSRFGCGRSVIVGTFACGQHWLELSPRTRGVIRLAGELLHDGGDDPDAVGVWEAAVGAAREEWGE